MGVDLVRSLQPPDILWIHWRVYNFIANTSKGVLYLPPSDAYVRSFLYLLYTLINFITQKKKRKNIFQFNCHQIKHFVFITKLSKCIMSEKQRVLKKNIYLTLRVYISKKYKKRKPIAIMY